MDLTAKQFIATQFRVFNNGLDVLCCAIWEYYPERKHFIEVGENLRQMHRKHAMAGRNRLPRQISHFIDVNNRVKYVVLWSNLHSYRYPNPPDMWTNQT